MAVANPSVATQKEKAADQAKGKAPVPLKRFTAAAREHVEQVFDVQNTIASSGQNFASQPIPAFGYLRALVLRVDATGGTGTVAVMQPDAPWSVVGSFEVDDTNGQPFYGPVSGYDMYLIAKWLQPRPSDPTLAGNGYSAPTTAGNFGFQLRVPVEITPRDGLGSLSNMNSSAAYMIKLSLADTSLVYSTNPTTLPTVRFRCYAEEWTEPLSTDLQGNPVEQAPPALGVTQEFSTQDIPVNAGSANPRLTRVGNTFRSLLFVTRNPTTGARSDLLADPVTYMLDSKELATVPAFLTTQYMAERYPEGYARDTGCYLLDFAHDFDGRVGDELRDQWLATTTGTRFELRGTNWSACTLHVITNDVLGYSGQA